MYRSPRGVTPDQQTDKESPLIDPTALGNVLRRTLDHNQLLTRLWIAVISRILNSVAKCLPSTTYHSYTKYIGLCVIEYVYMTWYVYKISFLSEYEALTMDLLVFTHHQC